MSQDIFRDLLMTVVGQAFTAAGYSLEEKQVQWNGGLFRFAKTLEGGLTAFIEFQNLMYSDSEWSSGMPSRFKVILVRSDGLRRDLSMLVVTDFGVKILPSANHWWTYKDMHQLGYALGEAGSLAIGYGMPWLSGDLVPPST